MVKDFVTLYSPEAGSKPFTNLTTLATNLAWTDAIGRTTTEYFDSNGIDQRWTREMVEAATRVNYGQVRESVVCCES